MKTEESTQPKHKQKSNENQKTRKYVSDPPERVQTRGTRRRPASQSKARSPPPVPDTSSTVSAGLSATVPREPPRVGPRGPRRTTTRVTPTGTSVAPLKKPRPDHYISGATVRASQISWAGTNPWPPHQVSTPPNISRKNDPPCVTPNQLQNKYTRKYNLTGCN